MNTNTPEQWRRCLLQLRDELLALSEQQQDAAGTVELDQSRFGRLSRMDALQAQQMAIAASHRREAQLARIEGALSRLDAGEFGCCFACGEEIDPRRLEADPTITRCVRCAGN